MAELRDADLRLSHAESLAFLTQTMGLVLSAEDAATLSERTEGWMDFPWIKPITTQTHTLRRLRCRVGWSV